MRILHLLDHYLPQQSGYAYRSQALTDAQKALGLDVHIMLSPRSTPPQMLDIYNGTPLFHSIPTGETPSGQFGKSLKGKISRIPVLKEIAQIRQLKKALLQHLKAHDYDYIHVHSPVLWGLAARSALKSLKRRQYKTPKLAYEIRAFWEDAAAAEGVVRPTSPRYQLTRLLETRLCASADQVFTICSGLKEDLIRRGLNADKITIIPNGVTTNRFPFSPKRNHPPLTERSGLLSEEAQKLTKALKGKKVIGFAGSFYRYEGLALLLEALPLLVKQDPQIHALLIGGGLEEKNLKLQAKASGLTDHVSFTGRLAQTDVIGLASHMDLMAFPRLSLRLTEIVTPLKPLEAMALGCPVIASDIGGHRELITDRTTGLLFKAGNPAALSEAIHTLLNDPDLRQTLITQGRAHAETDRNWINIAKGYAPAYETTL